LFSRLIKITVLCLLFCSGFAQQEFQHKKKSHIVLKRTPTIKYGVASFYADKFNVRHTASGEKYSHQKLSAACNVLPLNTRIKVTNLSNHKSVVLKINDRLNKKNKRLIDVSKSAAQKLGFVAQGITKVKVEVLETAKKQKS